jgi:hypothetical protein
MTMTAGSRTICGEVFIVCVVCQGYAVNSEKQVPEMIVACPVKRWHNTVLLETFDDNTCLMDSAEHLLDLPSLSLQLYTTFSFASTV